MLISLGENPGRTTLVLTSTSVELDGLGTSTRLHLEGMSVSSPILLSDDDIRRDLTSADALRWTEEALLRRARGHLQSPPRAKVPLSEGALVFWAGASGEDWYGFRAYDTLETSDGQGVVVAYDAVTGQVVAVAVGNELGARRTGALGAWRRAAVEAADLVILATSS